MADEEGRDGNDIIPGDVFVIGGGDDTRVSVTECNFSVLRDDGLAYADKSRFVDRVLSNPARVLLITRPRRFGKSLNLSMLRYFLDLRYSGNHWFDGLEIDTHHEYDDVRNAVPVVYIDLKDVRGMTSSENQRAFEKMIMHTVNGFRYLLDSDRLDDFMRGEVDRVINRRLPDLDDLSLLIKCLHAHHGVRPVLLIDEYEAPVLFAMDRGYFSDAMDHLRTVLSSLLKNNEHLGKAVITGVLQMAKEGMFSGVNNLYVSSVFSDDEFSDCFGLTEAEVSGLCEKAGCPERLDEIRAHYDGYRFGDTEVYSPYSVICYFQYSMRPDSYWVASGSDEQIGRMLNVADRHAREQLAVLLSGGTVDARIDSRLSFPRSGDVLEMDSESCKVVDKVHTGAILVDGLGVGDVGNIVLRDRQHLAEDGIIIVVLTLERRTNRLLAGPDIVSRGFVYVRESEQLMGDAKKAVSDALDKCLSGRHTDWNRIKLVIRDAMNDYIWKKTKRKPMVIPIIMDVDV